MRPENDIQEDFFWTPKRNAKQNENPLNPLCLKGSVIRFGNIKSVIENKPRNYSRSWKPLKKMHR